VSTLESEANDNKVRAENYRAQAAFMREMALAMTNERTKSECRELAAKWELLATRLVDFAPLFPHVGD